MTAKTRQALTFVGLLVVLAVGQRLTSSDDLPRATPAPTGGISQQQNSLLALPVPFGGSVFTGRVLHVSDGDTVQVELIDLSSRHGDEVEVEPGERTSIRLLRIDTPEEARNGEPAECWADEATAELESLAPEGSVLTFWFDDDAIDQYGRHLAHAWTINGTWINGELLARGAARVVTFRPNTAHDDRVFDLEAEAQKAQRGMWGGCF